MRIVQTTTEQVYFQEEENGALIAKLEVTKYPMIRNGYAVRLTLAKGTDESEEINKTAISQLSRLVIHPDCRDNQ